MSATGWWELLESSGIGVPEGAEALLERHAALVREWNRVVSLVSHGDLEDLWARHVVDSLSLVHYVAQACEGGKALVDIGSGAGFPAVPIKIILPWLPVVLVERSDRKVGFLRNVLGTLHLEGVSVVCEEFRGVNERGVGAVTARAVEKPEKLVPRILSWLPNGAVFLCQAGEIGSDAAERFHVEHVSDVWNAEGLRRGELRLLRQKSAT